MLVSCPQNVVKPLKTEPVYNGIFFFNGEISPFITPPKTEKRGIFLLSLAILS